MLSKVITGAINGIDGYIVYTEVDISQGLPVFDIVGLPDSAIKESKERVRTAIKNSSYSFPIKRIIINLAPAHTKKVGSSFDLPMAVGILSCIDVIPKNKIEGVFFAGELSLDGSIRGIKGTLSLCHSALKEGYTTCILPMENVNEASVIKGLTVYGVNNLVELVEHFQSITGKITPSKPMTKKNVSISMLDFEDVKGQEHVKRALLVAASGKHNALMIGPPGSGKTMIAKRLSSIMPPLTFDESISVSKVYSVAGKLSSQNGLIEERPFRSPHHTLSANALTGGGHTPTPGEISLAHNGILFLDELPEFQKKALEILRQPMEDNSVTISRVSGTVKYPANFMLIASMNPCPCGNYGSNKTCTCTPNEISRYLNKISGPLLDRIDIQVEATAVKFEELNQDIKTKSTSSKELKDIVVNTIKIQSDRYVNEDIFYNSELTPKLIKKYCKLGTLETKMLKMAFEKLSLSARAYDKIVKLARTIADIEQSENITVLHIGEALQYRNLDKKYWGQ